MISAIKAGHVWLHGCHHAWHHAEARFRGGADSGWPSWTYLHKVFPFKQIRWGQDWNSVLCRIMTWHLVWAPVHHMHTSTEKKKDWKEYIWGVYFWVWDLMVILLNVKKKSFYFSHILFSSVAQMCPTLCDPMCCRLPGLPVHHQLPEFTQTRVHWVSDAIQPSRPHEISI